MSDIIRVDLTPEEAQHLRVVVGGTCPACVEIHDKVVKAQGNPLNGPTFAFGTACARVFDDKHGRRARCIKVKGHSAGCVGESVTAEEAKAHEIDAEDTARLDEEHEAFEAKGGEIPEDEIPY